MENITEDKKTYCNEMIERQNAEMWYASLKVKSFRGKQL